MKLKSILVLTLSGALFGCGLGKMSKNSDELLDLSRQSSGKLDISVAAIIEAKKFTSYKEMLEDKNTEVLEPIPYRMIIPGKKLAAIITGEELAQLVYIQLREINGYQCENVKDETQKEAMHDKLARLYSLMIIAAFAPQATIQDMVEKQIYGATMFQKGALDALALRYTFLSEVMMDQSLMADDGFGNVGQFEEAVKTNMGLDYIVSLPVQKLMKVKVLGFCKADTGEDYTRHNRVITVDTTKVPAYWTDIHNKAVASQQVTTSSIDTKLPNGDYMAKYTKAMELTKMYLAKWGLK